MGGAKHRFDFFRPGEDYRHRQIALAYACEYGQGSANLMHEGITVSYLASWIIASSHCVITLAAATSGYTKMSSTYTKEIRDHLKYCATWFPNLEVRLGDVVILADHTYRRVASADEFGIQFLTRKSKGKGLLEHVSTGQVKINFFGSASGPKAVAAEVDLRAGLEVKFTTANAILFQAGSCTALEIENLKSVGDRVLDLYKKGKWREDYVLVTEVVRAERTTVLISSAADATAVFTAKADAELGPTSFIDVNTGLELVKYENIGTRTVFEANLTPLFRGFAVRKPILRMARFSPTRSRQQATFVEADYEDFI